MPTKDYNIQPYYDDFDETKGYHRVLFKPNFAVQARELTQAQTILQDQISKNSTFENGESMSSGQINIYTDIAYLSLSTDLSSSETATSIVGKVITNQTSLGGVTAKIIAVAPKNAASLESLTVYIAYLNATTATSSFADGNSLYEVTGGTTISTSAWKTIGKITGYTSPTSNVGTGSIAQVESGIYYINGFATYVPNQTIILDKFTTTPSYRIGFDVSETIATSSDDTSLNDNSVVSNNYQAPGADRHKIQLTLAKRSLSVNSTEGFVEVCEVVNGIVSKKKDRDDTEESFVVDGFGHELRENLSTITDVNNLSGTNSGGSTNKISFGISSGVAKIRGKDVRLKNKTYVELDKPRTEYTLGTTKISAGSELGNYVVTDGYPTALASNVTNLMTLFNFNPQVTVAESASPGPVYRPYPLVRLGTYYGSANTSNEYIGTARIRNIERDGDDLRIYLFDIEMDGGKILSDATSLFKFDSGGVLTNSNQDALELCKLQSKKAKTEVTVYGEDVTPSTIKETNKNALLHELPYKGLSAITGTVSSSRVRQTIHFTATSTTQLAPTISGGTLFSNDGTHTILYGRDNKTGSGGLHQLFTSTEVSVSGAGTANMVIDTTSDSEFVSGAEYIIITTVVKSTSNAQASGLSNNFVELTTKTDVEQTEITLPNSNIHPYGWEVRMSSDLSVAPNASSTDITSRYELDTGQRDDFIGLGKVRLKDRQPLPTGRILIFYWYYGGAAGDYRAVTSYPVGSVISNANGGAYGNRTFSSNIGGTTYSLSDVPIFNSPISGKKYRLNECIDLRPIKGTNSGSAVEDNTTFNQSDARTMIVPDKATISATGIKQYYGRIDKIYLDSDGELQVIKGTETIDPSIPENPSDGIPLYNVKLLPYTYDLHDIVVDPLFDDGMNKSQFDGISASEQSANDYGLEVGSVRRNTFSDPFVGHNFADVEHDDYSVAIDMQNGVAQSRYIQDAIPIISESATDETNPTKLTTLTVGTVASKKNIVTLPYASTVSEIQNLNSNAERTLRNTDAITHNGVVYVKEWDTYKSTKSRPMIKNRDGKYNNIPYMKEDYKTLGSIWNEWETEWYGSKDVKIHDPKLDTSYNELSKLPNYYNVVGKEINGKRVEGNYIPFISSKTITINAYGLKPNSTITSITFDGTEIVSTFATQTTDANGNFLSKTYTIPNVDEGVGASKFPTGSKKIVISGNGNYAEGYYHSVGLFDDEDYLTKPYDLSWDEQTNETMFQEIEIFNECFVTKLDLYFTAEDSFSRAVTIQLRKMEDGKPSNKVLPYSVVSKVPSDFVSVSSGTKVEFTFDETIYLQRGKYAIAIISPSVEYKIQTLKVEQTKGSKGTSIGDLFIGTKKITDEIIKFSLHRAKFTATTDDAILGMAVGSTSLENNPFKTTLWRNNNDTTVTVHHEGHAFSSGDTVSFSNVVGQTEHNIVLSANPSTNWVTGELVYQHTAELSGSAIFTKPYGRVITFNTARKTVVIATHSGSFSYSSGMKIYSASVAARNAPIASGGVHTTKRLNGLHIGGARSFEVAAAGTGYSDTTADGGVAVTGGSGTGMRVNISTDGGGVDSASVVFNGTGYKTNDVVTVSGGNGNAQLTVTARGIDVDTHTIKSVGLTPNSYALGGSDLVSLGRGGYAADENTVTVTTGKKRSDLIRYAGSSFVPNGTTLNWAESDDINFGSFSSNINLNENIVYSQSRILSTKAYLKMTMTGDSTNDRVSPVVDMGSMNSIVVANSVGKYISRPLELGESANEVTVVFDALLSQGNTVDVYAKTIESSSKKGFDDQIRTLLNDATNISTTDTTLTVDSTDDFAVGDIITMGEEDMTISSITNSTTMVVTRGTNQDSGQGIVHYDNDPITAEAVKWNQLTQKTNYFDADFSEYRKMVYKLENLSDFAATQIRIDLDSTNFARPPKIKNLRVIPSYKDSSLIPLQSVTKILTQSNVSITDFHASTSTTTVATDFVVEEATVFLTEVKNNASPTTMMLLSEAQVQIKRGTSGKVTPLETTNNTGCTVQFAKVGSAANCDLTAVVIVTGRRL